MIRVYRAVTTNCHYVSAPRGKWVKVSHLRHQLIGWHIYQTVTHLSLRRWLISDKRIANHSITSVHWFNYHGWVLWNCLWQPSINKIHTSLFDQTAFCLLWHSLSQHYVELHITSRYKLYFKVHTVQLVVRVFDSSLSHMSVQRSS